jgi:hypothetical protein
MRAIELEECDGCCRTKTIEVLWRVMGFGLLCADCCEQLREGELHG